MDTSATVEARALEVLEFPKVLQRLASFTSFPASYQLSLSLTMHRDYQEMVEDQALAKEAVRLLEIRPATSLTGMHDIRDISEKAAIGGILSVEELGLVLGSTKMADSLKNILLSYATRVPRMSHLAEGLRPLTPMVRALEDSISPRGEIRDSASPLLGALRRDIRHAHDALQGRLNSLVSSSRTKPMLQEPIITQRAGRYVVPVKAEFRGEFKGVVHDVSASGATLFMEPLEVVDLANRWREAQLQEEREVERVLRELSQIVGEEARSIRINVDTLAKIDVALAKARYCAEIRGTFPTLAPRVDKEDVKAAAGPMHLKLVNARHPLLRGRVVPFSLDLGRDFFVLVITGPNTGGKTVTLKSIGLLSVMALSALPIPANDGSVIPFFDGVYADIGDEQSIEQSLSTFSSHMVNIIKIMETATSSSLVLFDELGAGTDPQDGAALARAILSHLLDKRVTTVVTTHHGDLKNFAQSEPGVANASMEFNTETFAPTYHLSVGLPGRSNAIAIAQRLGMPQAVLAEARSYQPASQIQADELLAEIQSERTRISETLSRAEERFRQAEHEMENARMELQEIEESRTAIFDVARIEAEEALREVRVALRSAVQEIDRAIRETSRERLLEASRQLEMAETVMEKLSIPVRSSAERTGPSVKGPVSVGSRVWVPKLRQYGEVIGHPTGEGEVEVQVGPLKLRAPMDELEGTGEVTSRTPLASRYPRPLPVPPSGAETELHLRGMRVEEALNMMDSFIHDAYVAGARQVRIVHGKGTGTMRRAVREILVRHPLVKSIGTAAVNDGGEGVTAVELAE